MTKARENEDRQDMSVTLTTDLHLGIKVKVQLVTELDLWIEELKV